MTFAATSLLPLSACTEFTYPPAAVFLPLRLRPTVAGIFKHYGSMASIDLAPARATNLLLAPKPVSPRNPKSPYPPEVQKEIYEAAQHRQLLRAAKRVNGTVADEL